MSLASACWWTLARTVLLCVMAWPVCTAVERWLRGLSDSQRGWALGCLLAPFCFPELLVGYAFRDLALFHPRWAESLCSGLLFVRVVPVGAVALVMAPVGELDAAAMHCRWLLVRARRDSVREWLELARCYWHGPVTRALPALGLMSIVAFQEFELAALLMTTSWTDWFVAAERVGLNRSEMLRQTSWPLLMQLPVLLASVWWLGRAAVRRRGETSSGTEVVSTDCSKRAMCWFAAGYVAIALIIGCLVPLSLIGWRMVDGLSLLLRQRVQQVGLLREMAISTAVALCAGLTAWAICRGSGLTSPTRARGIGVEWSRSPRSRVGLVRGAILLPGLLGSLMLSLGVVTLFQVSWLRPLYDTPLPWVLALTLWLLPRAAVLQLWLDATRPSEAVHLAEMLQGRRDEGRGTRDINLNQKTPHPNPLPASVSSFQDRAGRGDKAGDLNPSSFIPHPSALLWRLRDQPQFLAVGLLCYWAYCDLPTAYLLAPTGMASGLVRLYNFMHFGRSAALSAEAGLFFVSPLVCTGFVLMLVRWWRG